MKKKPIGNIVSSWEPMMKEKKSNSNNNNTNSNHDDYENHAYSIADNSLGEVGKLRL